VNLFAPRPWREREEEEEEEEEMSNVIHTQRSATITNKNGRFGLAEVVYV